MIYIIIFFLMLMCIYAFDVRRHKTFYSFSYWGFFVILVLIAGLRYRIGTDSIVYEREYESFPALWEVFKYKFNNTRFEPGFIVFASITRGISKDFTLFQFFHAIVVNFVVFWFVLKNCNHRFLCLLFYFIALYLNLNTQVLRESLAVCCFLLSWPFFRDNKWILYYLMIALAFCFHTSAIILFILPLFCLPVIKQFFIFGKRTILIGLILLILGIYIQTQFSEIFSVMAFSERMMDRVNTYANTEFSTGRFNVLGAFVTITLNFIYPAFALYFDQKRKNLNIAREEKDEKKSKRKLRFLLKDKQNFSRFEMIVITGMFLSLFSIPMFIFGRYFNYFGLFLMVAIANWTFSVLDIGKKKIRLKPSYWAIILFPFFFVNLYSYNAPANRSGTLKTYQIYYPYNTRLDPKMDTQREAIYRYWNAR